MLGVNHFENNENNESNINGGNEYTGGGFDWKMITSMTLPILFGILILLVISSIGASLGVGGSILFGIFGLIVSYYMAIAIYDKRITKKTGLKAE